MSTDKDKKKVVDEFSGVETTGHEWDGLQELNNPLPRWWVWIFLITVIWSVWYWVVYPSWPTPENATKGSSGYTQFKELADSQKEIQARQDAYLDRFRKASFEQILDDPELYAFAVAGGASAFKDNCATCHGTGAAGSHGYPNLNDDDWLWGGKMSDIYKTLQYGIRDKHIESRVSQMPAFGKDGLLSKDEIHDVIAWIDHLGGVAKDHHDHKGDHGHHGKSKVTGDYKKGAKIFAAQCASCHGSNAKGLTEFGAPNLTDKIWLYGGDRKVIYDTIYNSRAGMMPAWEHRLPDDTLRQLTIYLHQLGGGQ